MINVAKEMGSNRLVPSRSVLYPTGDPDLSPPEEYELRKRIVRSALSAVQTQITAPTVIE
jgi:glycine reductase